jgi:hypothetical protein
MLDLNSPTEVMHDSKGDFGVISSYKAVVIKSQI